MLGAARNKPRAHVHMSDIVQSGCGSLTANTGAGARMSADANRDGRKHMQAHASTHCCPFCMRRCGPADHPCPAAWAVRRGQQQGRQPPCVHGRAWQRAPRQHLIRSGLSLCGLGAHRALDTFLGAAAGHPVAEEGTSPGVCVAGGGVVPASGAGPGRPPPLRPHPAAHPKPHPPALFAKISCPPRRRAPRWQPRHGACHQWGCCGQPAPPGSCQPLRGSA